MLTTEYDFFTRSEAMRELKASHTNCFASIPVPARKDAIPFVLEQGGFSVNHIFPHHTGDNDTSSKLLIANPCFFITGLT